MSFKSYVDTVGNSGGNIKVTFFDSPERPAIFIKNTINYYMQEMTIKEYAAYKNISVQAVHKRLKNIKNYPEIRSFKRISNYLFVLKVNTNNDLANKCNNDTKINLV